jgi:D-serine deaminase-like pyridoxal phosphate-dependent protein
MIKIDTGANRTGLAAHDYKSIHTIIIALQSSRHLHFKGFLVHNGQTYHVKNQSEIQELHKTSLQQLRHLKAKFADYSPVISLGDTPSSAICNDFTGIDELRPGNFVYYDYMQYQLGACKFENIACLLAVPVLSVQPAQNKIVIHGGAVHLSKESSINDTGQTHYGEIVLVDEKYNIERLQPRAYVTALSQEHGTISSKNPQLHKLSPGDTIGVIPIHSCLTANLMKQNTFVRN